MDFSREWGLNANVIEKDYVLGWVLAGISNHAELGTEWVFKGGTCLKKCYFETYRFSEDLDFTITNPDHLNNDFLIEAFKEVSEWVYENTGNEIPQDSFIFDIYTNPRGKTSVQGRISYRGPMQRRGTLPRIKLDITDDEVLVLDPVRQEVHHPYTDRPADGIHIQCYSFEEVYAEKVRALAERQRPRDLYDVVHLHRHESLRTDRALIMSTLEEKCAFKEISVPTMEMLEGRPERAELEAEWENMLAHQLPVLPPFEQFWRELPEVFDWLYRAVKKAAAPAISSGRYQVDETWHAPAMAQAWHTTAPLEVIRFAAANRLCVDLRYNGTQRLIEPYSLRRTKDGNLLLYAVKHNTGEDRSYRIDRIQGAEATNTPFTPRYVVELTTTGSISAPPVERKSSGYGVPRTKRASSSRGGTRSRSAGFGPNYVIECTYCGKKFNRKSYTTKLNAHKDKSGYPCLGRVGYMVDMKY
jgi:predicted nucleotidyltransferase component of viral defense system